MEGREALEEEEEVMLDITVVEGAVAILEVLVVPPALAGGEDRSIREQIR